MPFNHRQILEAYDRYGNLMGRLVIEGWQPEAPWSSMSVTENDMWKKQDGEGEFERKNLDYSISSLERGNERSIYFLPRGEGRRPIYIGRFVRGFVCDENEKEP
jgi:hypothetical protein